MMSHAGVQELPTLDRTDRKVERAEVIVAALEGAGIDFVVGLPDDWLATTIHLVRDHEAFRYVPVVNERSGACVCAGAWLGGKRPALLMEASGLLMATEALTRLRPFHLPFLIVVSFRGDLGDGNTFAIPQGETLPGVLTALRIPYVVVRDGAELGEAIAGAQQVLEIAKQPYAVLLGRRVVA